MKPVDDSTLKIAAAEGVNSAPSAEIQNRLRKALENWPGLIAHEYHRLLELMEQDHVIAAVWQLKDISALLINVPDIG